MEDHDVRECYMALPDGRQIAGAWAHALRNGSIVISALILDADGGAEHRSWVVCPDNPEIANSLRTSAMATSVLMRAAADAMAQQKAD